MAGAAAGKLEQLPQVRRETRLSTNSSGLGAQGLLPPAELSLNQNNSNKKTNT